MELHRAGYRSPYRCSLSELFASLSSNFTRDLPLPREESLRTRPSAARESSDPTLSRPKVKPDREYKTERKRDGRPGHPVYTHKTTLIGKRSARFIKVYTEESSRARPQQSACLYKQLQRAPN